MLKKLRFIVVYTLYLVIALALIDYFFFYRPYVASLRDRKAIFEGKGDPATLPLVSIPGVPPELMLRLGKMSAERKSFFSHVDASKPAGTIRVCSYGDSFTFGDEVDFDHDYPTLLQRRFDTAGATNVQVLNFGVSGFGFQQSYMLWDSLGRGFDCDFTLFGPEGFQPIRDTTFGFIHHWPPYYLHARYVLDDGDVRLLEIPGTTYGERFEKHFSFIPRWDVLRYDRNPPMFLRSLIPRNRELKNPFYYDRRSMEEEAHETYGILLAKMAASGGRFLVGHYDPKIVDVVRAVAAPGLAAADFYEHQSFPYQAPIDHGSPWSNQLVAEQFFRWLTGTTDTPLEVLATSDLERPATGWEASAPPFATYSGVAAEIAGVVVATPAIRALDAGQGEESFRSPSVLAFKGLEMSLAEACFLAFDGELRAGMKISMRAGGNEVPLGTVGTFDPRIRLGLVEIDGLQFPDQLRLFFRGNAQLQTRQLASPQATLLVDGREILRGRRAQLGVLDGIWLEPLAQRCRVLRGTTSGLVDIAALGAEGEVQLRLELPVFGALRVPLAGWHKAGPVDPVDPPPRLPERIAIAPDGTATIVPGA